MIRKLWVQLVYNQQSGLATAKQTMPILNSCYRATSSSVQDSRADLGIVTAHNNGGSTYNVKKCYLFSTFVAEITFLLIQEAAWLNVTTVLDELWVSLIRIWLLKFCSVQVQALRLPVPTSRGFYCKMSKDSRFHNLF
jgi:hypothetical protein